MLKWYRGRKCTSYMGWFEDVWPVPASGGGKKGWDWPEAMEPKISKDRSFQSLPVQDV